MAHSNGSTGSVRHWAIDFLQEFIALLSQLELAQVERAFDLMCTARDRGRMIYLAGNGGSASTASHWANDLGKGTKTSGGRPIRVVSLSDNISWLTALANDEGYERTFSGQLENFAGPDDLLVVISASGNSPNLIRAVETARSQQMKTIGLLGFDGGVLKSLVDLCVWLPSPKGAYGAVETGHLLLCHLLSYCLAQKALPAEQSLKRATA